MALFKCWDCHGLFDVDTEMFHDSYNMFGLPVLICHNCYMHPVYQDEVPIIESWHEDEE